MRVQVLFGSNSHWPCCGARHATCLLCSCLPPTLGCCCCCCCCLCCFRCRWLCLSLCRGCCQCRSLAMLAVSVSNNNNSNKKMSHVSFRLVSIIQSPCKDVQRRCQLNCGPLSLSLSHALSLCLFLSLSLAATVSSISYSNSRIYRYARHICESGGSASTCKQFIKVKTKQIRNRAKQNRLIRDIRCELFAKAETEAPLAPSPPPPNVPCPCVVCVSVYVHCAA